MVGVPNSGHHGQQVGNVDHPPQATLVKTSLVTQPGYPWVALLCQGILQPGGPGALLDFVGHAQYVTSTSSTETR